MYFCSSSNYTSNVILHRCGQHCQLQCSLWTVSPTCYPKKKFLLLGPVAPQLSFFLSWKQENFTISPTLFLLKLPEGFLPVYGSGSICFISAISRSCIFLGTPVSPDIEGAVCRVTSALWRSKASPWFSVCLFFFFFLNKVGSDDFQALDMAELKSWVSLGFMKGRKLHLGLKVNSPTSYESLTWLYFRGH